MKVMEKVEDINYKLRIDVARGEEKKYLK